MKDLTVRQIKGLIQGNLIFVHSLCNLCDIWNNRALSEGHTEEEAAKIVASKYEETLLKIANNTDKS